MKTDTAQKIITYIGSAKQATAKELVEYLSISPQAVFRQLKKLLDKGLITKIGSPPKVFYSIQSKKSVSSTFSFDLNIKKLIDDHFLFISPLGEISEGLKGFIKWCEARGEDPLKTSSEYAKTFKKYEVYKKNGYIDGLEKAKKTFESLGLNYLFYLDFYSIERFGKTKLGQYLLYAKQAQSKSFISLLVSIIKPKIDQLIDKYNIDGVCFVPPTVKREVQFMKELEKGLGLKVRSLSINKVRMEIPVPQKTLNKLEDRIENAKRTIIVDDKNSYKNVLIIDDAVGSGATINETAKQLKEKGIAKKVIGLAITGSFKGFDVISEV